MKSRLEIVLTRFNNWESEAEKQEYIDMLESLIADFDQKANEGNPVVPDSIYDTCKDYLRVLKPDSPLLKRLWTEDDPNTPFDLDLDKFLVEYPMMSIKTVKNLSDKVVKDFKDKLPLGDVRVVCTVKENGHGIRIVYKDGYLVKATSRGRTTNGRDITRQIRLILGEYNANLADKGLVEIRAEVLLPFSNLDKAREFNPNIKSAFTGVASMIRESASDEEVKLLHVVAYDILSDNLHFETLSEKLQYLQSVGFIVPEYFVTYVSRKNLEQILDKIATEMDIRCTDYAYHTDGVVVTIDDLQLFQDFGAEDSYRLGNLALKIGRWEQNNYVGVIDHIEWVNGKTKKTPVAVLAEGVLTATGNTVTNIPLYAPCHILTLEAYPGNVIHFKYGGEAGVIPVLPDGRLVTDIK